MFADYLWQRYHQHVLALACLKRIPRLKHHGNMPAGVAGRFDARIDWQHIGARQ